MAGAVAAGRRSCTCCAATWGNMSAAWDVVLNNLQLKAEALNSLQLPITVKAGFLGSVRLKVPWNRLGQDPVIVLLDRIFILAEPVTDDFAYQGQTQEQRLEAKRRRLEESEIALLKAKDKHGNPADQAPETSSWLGSLIATVVGNLKISITNVHIRYEDTLSNVSRPFCMGFMLAKLAAVTVDDDGHETFATSSALERLRKAVQLERLAVYHDTDCKPWQVAKSWDAMSPSEWSEMFEPGIKDDAPDSDEVDDARDSNVQRPQPRQYLLHPVHASMRYLRLGKNEKREPNVPLQTASLDLDDVTLAISESQYCDGIKLAARFSVYCTRLEFAQLRPAARVSASPAAWWQFASNAVLQQQQRLRHRMSWPAILSMCSKRRSYVELYIACLKQGPKADTSAIQELEADLDPEVILLWRMLAHAHVERAKSRESAAERERLRKSAWWSFGWGTGQQQQQQQHMEDEAPGNLSQEERSKINELMSYTPDEVAAGGPTKEEAPNMQQVAVDIRMQRNTAQILDCNGADILNGSFVSLNLALILYPKTVHATVILQSYDLSSPEGTLIQSVHRAGREAALAATFVQHPLGQQLDWMLTATMSPCHVNIWRSSADRFFKFLKSGQEASPSLVLETAAAVQSQLEAVRKQAQEQLQLVLQERSRFSLDLDLDAPKVTIPVLDSGGDGCSTQLLVDLGHFRLQTEPEGSGQDEDGNSRLYMRFRLEGSDISAFLADGAYDWADPLELGGMQNVASGASTEDGDSITGRKTPLILPVLDRCSMSVALHQILLEHASLPATRVGMRVPQLGFHFSPARYRRLMAVVSPLSSAADPKSSTSSSVTEHPQQDATWKQKAHLSSDLSVLTWTGLGNKVAEWQPRWCVLASIYFYVLEHEHSSTYLQYVSLVGKQIVEVPPEFIGGSQHVLAITARGSDVSKIHESRQAIILQAKDKDVKDTWLDQLTTAVYRTSVLFARAAVAGFEDDREAESPGGADAQVEESGEQADQADAGSQQQLFVIGVLDELKLSLSTQKQTAKDHRDAKDLEEVALLELRASTAKVEFEQRLYDLSLVVALRALQIEDLLSGSIAPSCRHMVQSASVSEQSAAASPDDLDGGARHPVPVGDEAEEIDDEDAFADAVEELPGSPDSVSATPKRRVQPRQGVEAKEQQVMVALDAPSFEGTGRLLHLANAPSKSSNFVIMQLSMLGSKSPDYDNTDMQMFIRMTTLELNCNRPTLVALMEFGAHLTLDNIAQDADEPGRADAATVEEPEAGQVVAPDTKNVVSGLLGRGKTRTTFRLLMDMESAHVALNLEDGSQLATLAEENLHLDVRLHPMSMAVNVGLGNLRICDSRLGSDHQWGYMCNIRDPNSSSLVSIEFLSFSKEDDDYKGFEYSLSGRLSAVRIIFLYRFIQELATYFSALATPTAGQVVSVLDPVGGFERLIQQSDMAGQPGLSLDFKLDSPLIVMPRDSNAHDYIQLNVGTMKVSNTVSWRGGNSEDPTAVHLDTIYIYNQDLNLLVGVNGKESKPMMQNVAALTVTVRRPLRDLFKRVPSLDVDIQVKRLGLVMSEREYGIVTSCAGANMSEAPNLPDDFRADWQLPPSENKSRPAQASTPQKAASQVALPDTASGPATSMRVVVNVMQADLELYLDIEREALLARMQVKGLWVEYRTTSAGEMGVLLTIPTLSVEDMRAGTKPEMRLMMGSITETDRWPGAAALKQSREEGNAELCCPLTMVVMDVRFKPTSQAVVIRIQRPRVLVVLDFLLAVGEFFVPSLGLVGGGRGGSSAADPLTGPNGHIQLTGARHNQQKGIEWLSPDRQLVADAPDVDSYEYDGQGDTLQLLEHSDGPVLSSAPSSPLIVVGHGKTLRFRNIRILGGAHLWASVKLGSNSRYMALREDNVELLESASTHPDGAEIYSSLAVNNQGTEASASNITSTEPSSAKSSDQESANFVFDLQAVAPELTFYDGTKWPVSSGIHPDRLLRSRLDLNVTLAMKGTERWMVAHGKGFVIEASSGSSILEPLNVMLEYSLMQGTTTMSLNVSDVAVRLSFSALRLLLRLQADLLATFHVGGDLLATHCRQFDRIYLSTSADGGGSLKQPIAIWRPRPPPGYAIVSHCATSGTGPPSQAVVAVSTSFGRVKKPVKYDRIWATAESGDQMCTFWLPVPPRGYAALGCIGQKGQQPPPINAVCCVREDLLSTATFSDCMAFLPPSSTVGDKGASIWRVENSAGSFLVQANLDPPARVRARDIVASFSGQLSPVAGATEEESAPLPTSPRPDPGSTSGRSLDRRSATFTSSSRQGGRQYSSTPNFERIWWDEGTTAGLAGRHVSIWRPQAPAGYSILGDCAVDGYEPPSLGLVVRDDDSGAVAKPLRFQLRAELRGLRGLEDCCLWFPVAPPGYVALGCVGARGLQPPAVDCCRCLRMDLASQGTFAMRALWSLPLTSSSNKGGVASACTIWTVENPAKTFICRADNKKPPWRMAYSLAEVGKKKLPDNVNAEFKIGRISCTVLDDLSGLTTPVVDLTVTALNVAAHGRPEALNAVAVTSLAASTFNTQLDTWEPLLEPFEGIFKYESNHGGSEAALKAGTQVRIAASSIVNLNISAANTESLTNAALGWHKASELEQTARINIQLGAGKVEQPGDEQAPALDQKEGTSIILDNALGCAMYAQTAADGFSAVVTLAAGEATVLQIPPQRYPGLVTDDLLTSTSSAYLPRHFVAAHIFGAQDLPVLDDLSMPEYLCALRLVTTTGTEADASQQKIMPQSARSRSVQPSDANETLKKGLCSIAWNEIFVFEIPPEGTARLELVIINQAGNAGTGTPVGSLAVPISSGRDPSKGGVQEEEYELRPLPKQGETAASNVKLGTMRLGICHFTIAGQAQDVQRAIAEAQQAGFPAHTGATSVQIADSPEGPWTGIRWLQSTGTRIVPRRVGQRGLAVEVLSLSSERLGAGTHARLRSLATLVNNCAVPLEARCWPRALLDEAGPASEAAQRGSTTLMAEEVFENQRYQPVAGWGSSWPGHLLPMDPPRWTSADGSKSSREFVEPALAAGWSWASDWCVDKPGNVDPDGWAYGADFSQIGTQWPPRSSTAGQKSAFDFVRRRRWTRLRAPKGGEQGNDGPLAGGSRHLYVGVVEPGKSQPLPWDSLAPGSDLCLQLRPHAGPGQPAVHKWGRSVPQHPASEAATFMLGDLGCTEELVLCEATGGRGRDSFWLSVEAVSSLLHGESGGMMAAEDWRIVAAPPLRVENWLPCRAEYTLWEKPSRSPPASRQRAIAESGATIQCHSIDVRRPILLTWLPQGGWKPEKEAVLISDPTAGDDLPTGFIMTNSASKRQLRVSVEHDIGKSEVSAKVVRLFVSYWLKNDANLPLAYRLVEIEASAAKPEEEGGLGKWLPRSSSASKRGGQRSMPAPLQAHKVLRALESIEDTPHGQPAMLSLPQLDRVGLSVALTSSGVFSSAICFKSFEDQMQRVDMKAVDQHGAFFKLTGWLDMSSLGFERTKVVRIQPHTLLTNRLGRRMHLRQANVGAHAEVLQPGDLAKPFLWPSIWEPELLQIQVDDYEWSKPFSTDVEGIMHIYMKSSKPNCDQQLTVRAEVRNGVDSSRFLTVFRRPSSSGPYRIENRTAVLPLKVRQAGPRDSTWLLLQPGSSASFAWEALQSSRLLEVMVEGASAGSASTFDITEPGDQKPAVTSSGAVAAIHVLVAQELLGLTVACICDWHPGDSMEGALALTSSLQEEVSASTRMQQQAEAAANESSENQYHIQLHLEDFGLSVVNHTPLELLYVSMQTAIFSYSTGLGSGISRLKLRIGHIQVDNQLASTSMPVLLAPISPANQRPEFVVKFVVAIQDTGAADEQSFPYISLQLVFVALLFEAAWCPTDTADAMQLPSEAWLISIHEPIIWRLHDLMRRLDFSRLTSHEEETTAVAVDPHVRIGLLNLSEGRLKVTLSMAPSQRPRDVLGVYSTLITSLGNTDEMPIRITPRTVENTYMRKSQMVTCALESVRNDLLSQPFQLLSGVDILGNASSALGHMSKGVAALSMDKQFIRSRQHQESKATVEGLGDGLREGGEALAKGLFRGVTGILTKPLEGAKSRGVEGFVTGVGKGIIGAAAQPASGVLDLLSKTTDGMNASRLRLAAAITYEQELSRRRLPRAISGDNVLRPYDDYRARGQIILQLAERGVFGDIDLFRERGKFAVTDAYEDHFNLPKGHSLMLTNRRHPSGMVVAKKADLLKEPCTIVWDITWDDLMTVELVHGKDDPPESPPTRLLLHLRDWSQDTRIFDTKEIARLVKCHPGTNQAMAVKEAIRQAMQVYGKDRSSTAAKMRAVQKPYTGAGAGAASGAALGLLAGPAAPLAVPVMATFGALVGGAGQVMLEADSADTSPAHEQPLSRKLAIRDAAVPLPMREDGNTAQAGRLIKDFSLLWWDKGAAWSKKFPVSIWRAVVPRGYVSVGDIARSGYDPPEKGVTYRDDRDGRFCAPEGYKLVWRDTESGARERVTIWSPIPPEGYVSLGAVAVADYAEPSRDAVACVRQDCVEAASLALTPLWKDHQGAALWQCSLWQVLNDAHTFLARRDHRRPPTASAFTVAI
eukprot:SM000173S02996  [mRNA]  locus=s173:28246:52241:- [translate_table: standard]